MDRASNFYSAIDDSGRYSDPTRIHCGEPLTNEGFRINGPRAGCWTVSDSVFGSAIDDSCLTVHYNVLSEEYEEEQFTRVKDSVRQVRPIPGSILHKLREITVIAERKRKEELANSGKAVPNPPSDRGNSEPSDAAAKALPGSHIPAVNGPRGIRVKRKGGDSMVVCEPRTLHKVDVKRLDVSSPRVSIPDPEPSVSERVLTTSKPKIDASTNSRKNFQVRVKDKTGGEVLLNLPIMAAAPETATIVQPSSSDSPRKERVRSRQSQRAAIAAHGMREKREALERAEHDWSDHGGQQAQEQLAGSVATSRGMGKKRVSSRANHTTGTSSWQEQSRHDSPRLVDTNTGPPSRASTRTASEPVTAQSRIQHYYTSWEGSKASSQTSAQLSQTTAKSIKSQHTAKPSERLPVDDGWHEIGKPIDHRTKSSSKDRIARGSSNDWQDLRIGISRTASGRYDNASEIERKANPEVMDDGGWVEEGVGPVWPGSVRNESRASSTRWSGWQIRDAGFVEDHSIHTGSNRDSKKGKSGGTSGSGWQEVDENLNQEDVIRGQRKHSSKYSARTDECSDQKQDAQATKNLHHNDSRDHSGERSRHGIDHCTSADKSGRSRGDSRASPRHISLHRSSEFERTAPKDSLKPSKIGLVTEDRADSEATYEHDFSSPQAYKYHDQQSDHCPPSPQNAEPATIYAGRGWISPHPLSVVSADGSAHPEPAIHIPSHSGSPNQRGVLTYEDWKQGRYGIDKPDRNAAKSQIRRNYSRTSSNASTRAAGQWAQSHLPELSQKTAGSSSVRKSEHRWGSYHSPSVVTETEDAPVQSDQPASQIFYRDQTSANSKQASTNSRERHSESRPSERPGSHRSDGPVTSQQLDGSFETWSRLSRVISVNAANYAKSSVASRRSVGSDPWFHRPITHLHMPWDLPESKGSEKLESLVHTLSTHAEDHGHSRAAVQRTRSTASSPQALSLASEAEKGYGTWHSGRLCYGTTVEGEPVSTER